MMRAGIEIRPTLLLGRDGDLTQFLDKRSGSPERRTARTLGNWGSAVNRPPSRSPNRPRDDSGPSTTYRQWPSEVSQADPLSVTIWPGGW